MSWPYDHDRVGTPIPKKDKNSPDTTSAAWDAMAGRWMMIDHLLGGTESMRAAGTLYLPQHPQESPVGWQNRIRSAILLNVTELTLNQLAGRPFDEPMKQIDIDPILQDLMSDVDTQGTSLDDFCRDWFREAVGKAFSHVLIDMPELRTPQGVVRTLADDRAEKRRPYLVRVSPENLIYARASIINGQEVLTHVRIREDVSVEDGFSDRTIPQIRVLEPGRVEIWQNQKSQRSNSRDKWVKVNEYETSLPFIPLVTFYAARDGLMLGKPPLLDLAYLNVRHWQSYSDQINVLTVARFPMLAASGVSDEEGIIRVGPNQVLTMSDSAGKFYYVEHQGNAIAAGANDLATLEQQMSAYGAQFLKKAPDRQAATSRVLDSAETMSSLGAMTVNFALSVSQVLKYMAVWLGKDVASAGRVELDASLDLDETTQWELQVLQLARQQRDISRKAFLEELKRRRTLSETYDPEADEEQIQQESSLGLFGPINPDLNPAEPAASGNNNPENNAK